MANYSLAVLFLNLALLSATSASPLDFARRQAGTQFITGECASDAECASTCCGFNSGLCAAIFPAQERDGGCGFGDPEPNNPLLARAISRRETAASASISRRQAGTQFITGECASDAECASTCCGFNSGLCAAIIPAQDRDGGCGFGDAEPNNPLLADGAADAAAEEEEEVVVEEEEEVVEEAEEEEAPAIAPGTQFITGECGSDADCATNCCGFNSGLCAAVIPAQDRDGGCGFGDPEPNNPLLK